MVKSWVELQAGVPTGVTRLEIVGSAWDLGRRGLRRQQGLGRRDRLRSPRPRVAQATSSTVSISTSICSE